MSQHAPTPEPLLAVGYACNGSQRVEVQGYAASQGYRLVEMVEDQRDTTTISQITQHSRDAQAHIVILPGAALLSAARNRLEKELARLKATCVVLGAPNSPTPAVFARVLPRRALDAAITGRHAKEHTAGRHHSTGTTDDI
ncbi:hypothetical protein [Myceligenerans pegani]|uniref:Uncharacterized protein n=1 Tax=Myceligenerans pegani TaxID=2776917 RepID=A0ABR9MZA3_9MICO|nr:hypothetical protein [Myceligenerans sp. TRM 65318]MBE1876112.1 hypothetical protein [Myceligenerans sp. TRM 65318]MBE3018383.1 hypothetical protein [Myceligenerans sp. TRM 65318]